MASVVGNVAAGIDRQTVDTTDQQNATFSGSDGTYTIEAAGDDVWTADDQYGAIYEADAFDGAGTVVTTVESQESTDDWAKAGVMVANDITAPGSSAGDVVVEVTPGNGFVMSYDSDGDGYLDVNERVGSATYPCTLKLERSGTTFTGYYSTDGGDTFTEIHTIDLPEAASTQDAGIFDTAHSSELCTVEYSDTYILDELAVDTTAGNPASLSGSDGTYTIEAAGDDIWTADDQYGAIYEADAFDGAGTIVTTVESQEATDEWAKAGVMVANDITAPGSSAGDVVVEVTPGNGFVMSYDSDGDGYLDVNEKVGSATYPCTLKLERSGTTFTGAYSTDGGDTFTTIHTVDISEAASTQDAGIFDCSHSSERCTVEYSDTAIIDRQSVDTTDGPPASFRGTDGTYTIEAAGNDIWKQYDDYGAIYERDALDGTGTVVTTVESQEATDEWAKAGVMIANDITAPGSSAGDVVVEVTPGNGFVMSYDSDGDGYIDVNQKVGSASYPCTLRLDRDGTTFTGYYSTDGGGTFTEIHTVDIADAASTQDAGIFNCSHSSERSTVEYSDAHVVSDSLPAGADALDRIVFGNKSSEAYHGLDPEWSTVVQDGDGVHGRALHFPESGHTNPIASTSFTVTCDPTEQTYITVKLRQDPANRSQRPLAVLDGDDDQVGHAYAKNGWRCLTGMFYSTKGPFTAGEWVYVTMPLPKYMTEGKEEVEIRLATMNYNHDFCCPFEDLWPVYRVYTHTDPLFATPSDESGSEMYTLPEPDAPTVDEQLAELKDRVEGAVDNAQGQSTASPLVTKNLARAYGRDWISTVDEDAIFQTVRDTIDDKVIKQAEGIHPSDMFGGNSWSDHGYLARAFELLSGTFENRDALSENMSDHPDAPITRQEAYADFFVEAYKWREDERKAVTNQVQIVIQALVSMNDALEFLDAERAPADSKVDTWIDQAIGVAKLEKIDSDESGNPAGQWHIHTEAGLNKEPAYSYGHGGIPGYVLLRMAADTGLDRVLQRLMDYIEAMGWFRFEMLDPAKDRPTNIQDQWLANRGPGWPGGTGGIWVGYGVRPASAAMLAASSSTVDNEIAKRWGELMVEYGDTIFYNSYDSSQPERLQKNLWLYEGVEALRDMDASTYKLPRERERAVFSDPDHGMVSITDGEHRLLVSLGHDPCQYISNTVVTHYKGPDTHRAVTSKLRRREFPTDRTASMPEGPLFELFPNGRPEGEHYMPWRNYTKVPKQGLAKGEDIALASKPDGSSWSGSANWPDESAPWIAGWTYFYREADVGPYRIGVNSTGAEDRGFGTGQTFEMPVPGESAIDLKTGEEITADTVTVEPRETRVVKGGEW